MKNKNMKYFSIFGVVILLLTLTPTINANNDTTINSIPENDTIEFGLLKPQLTMDYDSSEIPDLIKPNSNLVNVEIQVSYHVEGLFARIITFLLRLQQKTIPIEITMPNIPKYCHITIDKTNFTSSIDTKPYTDSYNITIGVDMNATAYKTFTIDFVATAPPFKGPLKIFNLIKSAEFNLPIELTPDYVFAADIEHPSNVQTPPLETTEFIIDFFNLGNAVMLVETDIIDPPVGWDLEIPTDRIILMHAISQFELLITPPANARNENIEIEFKCSCYEHPEGGYYYFTTIVRAEIP